MKSFFDVLKNVTTQKDNQLMESHISTSGFDKMSIQFMLLRYLSMSNKYEHIVFEEQPYLNKLTNESLYRYLMIRLPKTYGFIKYIK